MATLTATHLRAPWRGADRWLSDKTDRGAGRLVARLRRNGVVLYFRYRINGQNRAMPLGAYDESGARGLTLRHARDRAAELAALIRSGVTDLHGHFDRQREAEERARVAAEEAGRRAQEAAQRSTLKQLIDAYVAHLESRGKPAARDSKSIFRLHVFEVAPDLAMQKAADVSVDEFVALIGRLAQSGKGRTAAKLRSYLRAAYSLALSSRTDPAAPQTMRSFGISTNPVASVSTRGLREFNRTRNRVLSAPELKAFMKRVGNLPPGAQRDALQLNLLLGGQRPAQLLRATPADVDLSASTITLYDAKGARQQPRTHVIPLTKEAGAILKRRISKLSKGEPLFSTDSTSRMRPETLSAVGSAISDEMLKAKEAREAFELRDIRRTCETMLAALGVSKDIRAQIQSHGLGGVQARHYDRHEYLLEKRQALEKWARHLERVKAGKTATVTQLRRPASA